MEIANIHEAKTQLSKLVERALEGEEVIIAHGRKAGGPSRADSRERHAAKGRSMERQGPDRRGLRRAAR